MSNKIICSSCSNTNIWNRLEDVDELICNNCGKSVIHKPIEETKMEKIKEMWASLLAYTASKGISPKGTMWVIGAFVLGAWIF